MGYDFSTLSPHDFELLVQDLLQEELKVRLEGFKSGKDGGIDLRHCAEKQLRIVVQCKHYRGSSFSRLKRTLVTEEFPKVHRLSPKRYIVATSHSLSAAQKNILSELLSPYCQAPSDVLGAEDLNTLLRKHREIEQTHFKLWIASTSVLQKVLHNDLFARTYLDTGEIKRRLSLYVPTGAVKRATGLLESKGFCLLSGIPGIGKTTTAEILVAMMLEKGWQCVCISSNAAEALKAYQHDARQLFYYDDFLGVTSIDEKLEKNEDRDLLRLIQSCCRSPDKKRLVLTTRDYLLSQALDQHEVLGRAGLEMGGCVVELADYTPKIRAEILVNHLWFYGVKHSWCQKLVKEGKAKAIVSHEHYSPRLVEQVCKRHGQLGLTSKTFGARCLQMLDDPGELWRVVYYKQISEDARELMLSFASLGNGAMLEAVNKSHRAFAERAGSKLHFRQRFQRALRELEGTFVRVEGSGVGTVLTYHNPSVKDFMDSVFADDLTCALAMLNCSLFYNQVGYAARHALKDGPNVEISALVIQNLEKHLDSQSPVPEREGGTIVGFARVRPAQRLLAWRRAYRKTPHKHIRVGLCKLSMEYLNAGKYHDDSGDEIAALAECTSGDATLLELENSVDIDIVVNWLLDNISTYDDYVAAGSWFGSWHDGNSKSAAISTLHEAFIQQADCDLDDLTDDELEAWEIESKMQEILEAADNLGVDHTRLDMYAAEEALEAAEEAEQSETGASDRGTGLRRVDDDDDDIDVDDILDSLL